MPNREKRIEAGNLLLVGIYFISKYEQKKSRKQKKNESRKEQKNLNEKNSFKNFNLLINNNFTTNDINLALTYTEENRPNTPEEVHRDFKNFIRRMNRHRKKIGLPNVKYVATIEKPKISKKTGKPGAIHIHAIIDGKLDRDMVESFWDKGRRNADRLQESEAGFIQASKYMLKQFKEKENYEEKGKFKKRWIQSKDIRMPEPNINDYKYSRKKVIEIYKNFDDYRMLEKLYPGYVCVQSEISENDFTGKSIYITFKKIKQGVKKE